MSVECVVFKRWKDTLTMPCDPQSAPDIVFLRNTGIALLALTVAVGAISIVGALKTSKPLMLAQSAEGAVPAADLLLQQIERNISRREELQAQYVNPKSI
jgi:hypothetical protein